MLNFIWSSVCFQLVGIDDAGSLGGESATRGNRHPVAGYTYHEGIIEMRVVRWLTSVE